MAGIDRHEPAQVQERLSALGWSPGDLRRALHRLGGSQPSRQTVYRWIWGPGHKHGRPAPPLLLATLELLRRLPKKQRDALRAPCRLS